MDSHLFVKPAGQLVQTPQGHEAFIPAPLPRYLELTPSLLALLSRADRSIGELMGMARMLPNQQLLIAPLTQRESVLSSQIEGTQASVADLAIFEASGEIALSPHLDVREVRNYRRALNYGIDRLSTFPLSLRFVRELHHELLHDTLGQDKTPGEFRSIQNWIGAPGCEIDEATYVPPPPTQLMTCLSDWEAFVHDEGPLPTLIKCALLHYQFEAIHPFVDGNGRVGRLLLLIYLLDRKYISTPIFYLSPFFARHRDSYYSLLRGITERSEWEEWIEFFLRGVIVQSRDGLKRTENLIELQQKYRERLQRASRSVQRLLDLLFSTPAITVSNAALRLDVTWVTANSAISLLVDRGILREVTGQRRDRVFLAQEIVDTINQELSESSLD
ncbi:MAG TPA: Fic family protein [Dehalococcoidia bacterium]|nr:Fic family protein [Dehalococcoidia bacterium]